MTGEFLHSRLSIRSPCEHFAVSQQPNIGSRVYLLAPGSTSQYQTFDFRNQEFVSPLQCSGNNLITHLSYFRRESPLRTDDYLILKGRSFDVDVSQVRLSVVPSSALTPTSLLCSSPVASTVRSTSHKWTPTAALPSQTARTRLVVVINLKP